MQKEMAARRILQRPPKSLQSKNRVLPLPTLQSLVPPTIARQQCCVVCYQSFTPFEFNSEIWDSNMIKNFYISLGISSSLGSSETEEEEEVLSLPFCPQCHTKVSIMAAYQIELQNIRSKCNSMRNDIAFTVVETIGKNARVGPIDFIRQQIYEKWKLTYEENRAKLVPGEKTGLEYIACDPSSIPHNCGNFICYCHSSGIKSTGPSEKNLTNGPRSEFEFSNVGSVHKSSVNRKAGKRFPPSKAKRPSTTRINSELPPLLSPHRAKLPNNEISGLFRNSKGVSVGPKKSKAHVQRLTFGTPNTSFRRKPDYSHVKPRVTTHLIPKAKSKSNTITKPSPSGQANITLTAPENIPSSQAVSNDVNKGKRKLAEIDSLNGNATKMIRRERSPTPQRAEIVLEEGIVENLQRSSRTSPRSPQKTDNLVEGHPNQAFKCSKCPKEFPIKSRLLRHESYVHPECKIYQCEECSKGFSSKESYRRHVLNTHKINVTELEIYRCPVRKCRKTFLTGVRLEEHMKDVHANDPEDTMMNEIPVELEAKVKESIENVEKTIEEVSEEPQLEVAKPPVQEIENKELIIDEPINLQTVVTESLIKSKRKPPMNRLFGGRKRKRGGKKKKKSSKELLLVDESGLESKPLRKPKSKSKPEVSVEPVRKSSRQRGVQLDVGKPMYPQPEQNPKITKKPKKEMLDEETHEMPIIEGEEVSNLPNIPEEKETSEHSLMEITPTNSSDDADDPPKLEPEVDQDLTTDGTNDDSSNQSERHSDSEKDSKDDESVLGESTLASTENNADTLNTTYIVESPN